MKKIRMILCAGVALILNGCDGDIVTPIRVQDLLAVRDSASIAYTTATIIAGNVSKDEEKAFIKSVFPTMTNERMEKSEYADAWAFDIRIPIVPDEYPVANGNGHLPFHLVISKINGRNSLSCRYHAVELRKISDWVKETYSQIFDVKDYTFSLIIINDSQNDFEFTGTSVYVNDEAYPYAFTATLAKKDSITVKASGILNEAMSRDDENLYPILTYK